jgi:ligand-binding sensor domain-containing protein/signal transduction histidine kinase
MNAGAVFVSAMIHWAALSAQPFFEGPGEHIKFERLTVEQGLSQNTIQCLLQDRQGFLWFGTRDGLNRYDGYSFTVYKPEPQNTQSLSDNQIESLYEDRLGILWIGTLYGGLNRFDAATESFRHYKHDPQNSQSISNNHIIAIYEDRAGVLWFGTEAGLNRFDRATETFRRYQHDPANPSSLSDNSVSAILEDSLGELWIGTVSRGLARMGAPDREAGIFRTYQHDPQNPQSLASDVVNAICEDQAERLWIGTSGGLSCLRREDRGAKTVVFRNYQHNPKNPYSLSQNYIRSIYADRSGVIWIAARGGGLNRFDPARETTTGAAFRSYQNDPQNPFSLSSNDIYSIYEDRSGGMWLGTRAGANRFERVPLPFQHYQHDPKNPASLSDKSVWAIYEDRAGDIWIGTLSGGLDRFERATGTPPGVAFTHFRYDVKNSRSLSDNSVWSIYEDQAGTLWIGTRDGGLNQFDRATKTFRHFRRDPNNPRSLSYNWVTSIHESRQERDGVLWIGTWGGGLNRFERHTGIFKNYRNDPQNPHSLSSNGVWLIYEDRAGVLWLGTEIGLERFDRATETFKHYHHDPNAANSLSNNSVWSIHEDRAGALWIGTSSGLNRFDRHTETFKHYREKDGLPNDVIYGILEDARGNLWLSTNKGIVKFNPETGTIKSYEARDGLQSNEFNANAAFQNRRGEMFFGGIDGFNVFHPDSVKDNPYVPPVVITALKRYNTDVAEGIAISEKGIAARDEIVLSYKDNILNFEFAALSFRNSFKNQYAVRLEGFNDNWIQLGAQRQATFTNLSPGEYTLQVKGSNNDGVWNEAGAALKLSITPPWWKTRWAYALYAALGLGLLYAARGFELKQREQKTMLKESELRVLAAEAQAQALQAENARQESELQKAAELESAYQALEEAHAHLQATQQQLVTQEKLASLGQLTAGIAHEIKNPLNFVNNFAVLSVDLAKELRAEIEKHKTREGGDFENLQDIIAMLELNVEKINHHGQRADNIVKSMMQHAHGVSGQRAPADINRLLDEAVDLTYHGLRAKDASLNIAIEKEYDESIGKLNVVPQNISRVFLNLINNACYAAQEKQKDKRKEQTANADNFSPALGVRTKNLDDKIEIRIRDNGNGIPAGIHDKIFSPFFTTKPAGQGAGLGLSISYDIIVQEHKGEIKFATTEGSFTEFMIYLPKEKN